MTKPMKDTAVNPADCDIVVGCQPYQHETVEGNPMLVFVLDTDNEDAKRLLWGFGEEEYYRFVRTLLNASQLFEDANNGKPETET